MHSTPARYSSGQELMRIPMQELPVQEEAQNESSKTSCFMPWAEGPMLALGGWGHGAQLSGCHVLYVVGN